MGVAQAASAAGYQVTLIESRQLAYGTSSRSSKLIHGGLRYLESAEFGLVRESLRERELLLKIAPDLVERQDFLIPIYAHTSRRPWTIRAGLTLYTLLAGLQPATWFRRIPRSQWTDLDGLKAQGLQCVFRYTDAQTDDRELTRAVMRSAQSLGAQLLCPAEFLSADLNSHGCRAVVRVENQDRHIGCRVIVNAAGPWANQVLARVQPPQPAFPVENVQGTHLELPGEVRRGCYYLEMPQDGRASFVMPWKGRTLLGTTEHIYHGDPAEVRPLEQEVDYLLAGYQHYFPDRSQEVLASWSGLRVLPAKSSAAFKRSRETQLPVDDPRQPRLLSIFGGKLTGYRATALKVMRQLEPVLPTARRKARTSELRLSGEEPPSTTERPVS